MSRTIGRRMSCSPCGPRGVPEDSCALDTVWFAPMAAEETMAEQQGPSQPSFSSDLQAELPAKRAGYAHLGDLGDCCLAP